MRSSSTRNCILLLCLACLCVAQEARAQSSAKPKRKIATKDGASSRQAADPLKSMKRATAISLVNALADEAPNFNDINLRARVQGQAADALWQADEERARTLFRRAWEAAEAGEKENQRLYEEELKKATGGNKNNAVNRPALRREILRLAARRDRQLGEEFLAKLDEEFKKSVANVAPAAPNVPAAPLARHNPFDIPPMHRQRLNLAEHLLQSGDEERALLFADPTLDRVTLDGITFLTSLRDKNPAAADKRFEMLLRLAVVDPLSDANTVSMLSSYALTPFYFIGVTYTGTTESRSGDLRPRFDLAPSLRTAFFQTAAQILLRPLPPPDQDRTLAGRTGKYIIIMRLLPFFEPAMAETVALLREHLAALTPDVPERFRDSANPYLTDGIIRKDAPASGEDINSMLEQLDNATDSAERDKLLLTLALRLSLTDPIRARELADKISDGELRRQVRAYVDFDIVRSAIGKKDTEEIVRHARAGELTPLQRAWAYTEAARHVWKQDRVRAAALLDEASAEAQRIAAGSPERVRALVAVATQYLEVDAARAWEIMAEVVKASKGVESFTGEGGVIVSRLETKTSRSSTSPRVPSFDLAGVFKSLAKIDLQRAIEMAKSFNGESPRSLAILAVVRSVLEEKR